MTTAQIEQKRTNILENIVLTHYNILLECNSIAKKASKLKVFFEVSETFLKADIDTLFVLNKSKYTLPKPETCIYLKKIEVKKCEQKVFLIVFA